MPTPVSAARQCLTEEAARALDDAVGVARRRGHAQTTSLHAVSALLALPSSALREACARARSSAYLPSPRLQFRALELSVGVSLDRLPSSKAVDEPPVSNSLMAAIKRSQANQRRHPDSFHFHHQLLSAGSGAAQAAPVLRVEIKHFVLSILDDPIVSRVFGEAGFRSCDVKLAILQPPVRQLSPYGRRPPLFLCNITDPDLSSVRRSDGFGFGFNFPFARAGEGYGDGDMNSRRIGEVMARKSGRNPLLMGVCASEALKGFIEALESRSDGVLPPEIGGLKPIVIEKEVSEFLGGGGSEERLNSRIEEAGGQCGGGAGVVLSFGDLKSFVGDRAGTVVSRLTNLLELHTGKLWLIGTASSYEAYLKFSGSFPSVEKDWDLHILPISFKASAGDSKSSLMGSFVPFGGFFAAPSELKSPCSSTNQYFTRCITCTEKYKLEVSTVLKAGSTLSVSSPYSESLPCLQMAELDSGNGADPLKAKDGRTTLTAKISELQKKWNEICQRHHAQPTHKTDIFQVGPIVVPSAEGFRTALHPGESGSEDSGTDGMRSVLSTSSCTVTNLHMNGSPKQSSLMVRASDSEKSVKGSDSNPIEVRSSLFRPRPLHAANLPPVTTDLGLGTIYASPSANKEPYPSTYTNEFDSASGCATRRVIQPSSRSIASFRGQFDCRDPKSFKRVLFDKVGRQEEAISAVSQVVCCVISGGGRNRGSNLRGDIWLTFVGPDKVAKKRIALALAEMLYGSKENLISVDLNRLSWQENSVFQDDDNYDLKFRGKVVVDYLAGELGSKQQSVVFLENIDKADMLTQNSLSLAIRTGKFRDSRGREIGISNTVFVTTMSTMKGYPHQDKEPIEFPEETILTARRFHMKIVLGSFRSKTIHNNNKTNAWVSTKEGTLLSSPNKRKLNALSDSAGQANASRSFLDLNLPVEEIAESDDYGDCDSDSISESTEAWLEDFLEQVDEKVALKHFDFDALSAKILEGISKNIKRILGPEVELEIDYDAMIQILGAAWLSQEKSAVEDWIERVLCRGFSEAEKYKRNSGCVMRLVTTEPLDGKEQTCCVCLPARISLS